MSFVHLHVHSSYSVLDGFGKPANIVARVKELGMPAVALTDHGTMFGTMEFYKAATAAGIKPIIGLETYLAPRSRFDKEVSKDKKAFHLVLLAENNKGYHNLLEIASAAQLEGFYYHPRIDKEFLASHSEGLIATTACISGEVARAILENDYAKAQQAISWYLDVFGQENFYLELQEHNLAELTRVNRGMMELARKTGAKLVATNDVHYVRQEDAELQDILLAVQTGRLLSEKDRMSMNDDSYYIRSPQEMAALFPYAPEAITNTLAIAERCEVDLRRKGYHLPKFELPAGEDSAGYLRELCLQGLQERIPERLATEQVQSRLDFELGVISQMGFDEYFLIVWDLCRFSREQGIWYNVRGSGNGSLVAYALEITSVEPLQHTLLFERFLNPDRVTMPDIDLDFQDDRRAEVMEYCNQKYGADRVAQIITFGTMAARGAIRDVGRVMNIPLADVDRVAKLVPGPIQGKQQPISVALATSPELKAVYDSSPEMKTLIDKAGRMEGAIRNIGTHAAGVIISDKPLTTYLPLHRPTSQSEDLPIKVVTQYEMDVINDLGLLKVDFLGLVTLTIMSKACEFIEKRHGKKFDLDSIPTDDAAVFKFIGEGHTIGLFQLEGNGMTRYIMQMQPEKLEHVIAMCALFRPGPMEIIPQYIENMHGRQKVVYQHPWLEDILGETYGHAVYQEQIMMAARKLANYTPGESDDLRSAISKKKEKEVKKHRQKFINGAVENGIAKQTAEEIFAHWEAFAHYGFNKSHATNYGMIAVKTGWLKYHYPVEYMTALLSAWKNDNDKCAIYVAECRGMGIEVLPPDVNTSGYDFVIEERPDGKAAVRFGLGAVKNVGAGPVEMIMQARQGKPFENVNDFVRRVDLRSVGKRALECLVKVGALDNFGSRQALLLAVDQMANVSASHFRAIELGQMSLFGGLSDAIGSVELHELEKPRVEDLLEWEKELLGIYVTEHPLSQYMSLLSSRISHLSKDLADLEKDTKVNVGGMLKKFRSHITRKGDEMAFATLEDNLGEIDLVLFPKVWEKFRFDLQTGGLYLAAGKVDSRENGATVLVDQITKVDPQSGGVDMQNTHNKGPFYERTLEKYLPDMQALSKYAFSPNGSHGAESAIPMVGEMPDFEESDDLPPLDDIPWDDDEMIGMPDLMSFEEDQELEQVLDAAPNPEGDAPPEVSVFAEQTVSFEATILETVQESAVELAPEPEMGIAEMAQEAVNTPGTGPCLVITIPRSEERDKDFRRLKMIYGFLSSHPGEVNFAFYIEEPDSAYMMEFPNETFDLSRANSVTLAKLIGEENIELRENYPMPWLNE